jgi:acyl carrier protein
VEPSDVEGALLRHPAVTAAAVTVADDSGGPTLVAHLVADGASDDEIRSFLADQLPTAAIPMRYARHSSLPRLPGGKIDRANLSAVELPDQGSDIRRASAPLVSETERRVGEIWSEVLSVEPIGRNSHFFQLGGQSLLALRMIAKVRRELGLKVSMRTIFDAPTLEGFSALLDTIRGPSV